MTVEERINELQKQIDELKAEVENGTTVFKRAGTGEEYYTLQIESGELKPFRTIEEDEHFDDCRFDNNNYFYTEERAKEVAEKINALLKFERIHDMLCPEYKPDWNDETVVKCSIMTYGSETEMFKGSCYGVKSCVETYFPTDKIDEAIKLYKEMP